MESNINIETYYLINDGGWVRPNECITFRDWVFMYPIQLTPNGYFRYYKEPYNRNGIDAQIRAEFTNLTNFNDIKDEKYIEL